MKYGIVYKFTNTITNKSYIGVTTLSLEERLNSHMSKANIEKSVFQKSLKKYGKVAFIGEVLFVAFDKQSLFKAEIELISSHNTLSPNGYNISKGGYGACGMTVETKLKISKTKTGKSNTKSLGKQVSKETRIKISQSMGSKKIVATNLSTGKSIYLDFVNEGRDYGFNPSLISACLKNKEGRTQHKNYKFNYVEHANTEGN